MILHFDTLPGLRLPDYPDAPLTLDGHPLSIFKETSFSTENKGIPKPASVPHGIATILYRWCPTALVAFLDLDAWFSLTWTATLPSANPGADAKKLEIGRVGSQVTFGTLDSSGENWEVMLTYNVASASDEKFKKGQWVPNTKESMLGEKDVKIAELVDRLGDRWVQDVMKNKSWEAAKGVKHTFHVEYAPMDIFGDGIPTSPHLLYQRLDLDRCTTCSTPSSAKPLNRCGRCGTAAYCTAECQKQDWKVHKWVCTMSVEDRGMAIKVSEKGGLYRWDAERTMAARGEEVKSENPFFETVQLKRIRAE
ncbi:MYND finger [Stagonosporopsis vannaccii]|nr:MYND finger [Stagonosporopsis vannaccii]